MEEVMENIYQLVQVVNKEESRNERTIAQCILLMTARRRLLQCMLDDVQLMYIGFLLHPKTSMYPFVRSEIRKRCYDNEHLKNEHVHSKHSSDRVTNESSVSE
jgi:hypothetical protein